jgi:rhomboid protease GluP
MAPSPALTDLMRGRLTPATLALIGMNVAVFALMLLYGAGLWHSNLGVQLAWGAGFGPATKDGEWWRLATAMFLHFGLLHLAINMWALWDAGRLVERVYGRVRFLTVYFASGLSGNLLSLVTHGDQAISGGASGAIFGVYGALLVFLWRERRGLHPVEFRWLFGGAAAFAAATIAFGFVFAGVDNAAHIGGLTAGTLVGIALARPLSEHSPLPGRGRWLAAAALACAMIGLVAAIPAPSYHWRDEAQARAEIRAFLGDDARLNRRWQGILDAGRKEGASFEELAGRIDAGVTREYERSFGELSAIELPPAAPSAATLLILKRYAQLRGDAFHALAEGLRTNDSERIRAALDQAREAAELARRAEAPPAPAR